MPRRSCFRYKFSLKVVFYSLLGVVWPWQSSDGIVIGFGVSFGHFRSFSDRHARYFVAKNGFFFLANAVHNTKKTFFLFYFNSD